MPVIQFLITLLLLLLQTVSALSQVDSTKQWYHFLPACPCTNPDMYGVQLNDGWARDKGNIAKYHRGATASFRSYPAVKTPAGKSGQQCCYDSSGRLIKAGSGAGTPDKVSTCKGENKSGAMKIRLAGLWGHYFKDVRPWQKYMKKDPEGWRTYNQTWLPNTGNNCP